MIEAAGDLWTHEAEYRLITTNGVIDEKGLLIMGAGVALDAKKRFPHLPYLLGGYVFEYGNRPFILKTEKIITFPTKRHWRDLSDVFLIRESAKLVVAIVDKFGIKSVVGTRPGCGNGGLDWKIVKPYIADVFDDRFTFVTLPCRAG